MDLPAMHEVGQQLASASQTEAPRQSDASPAASPIGEPPTRAEQDEEMKVVEAQSAERQTAAIERALVEADAQRKAELAAARRLADEAKVSLQAQWEKEAAERLQAAVQKVQLEMDAKLAVRHFPLFPRCFFRASQRFFSRWALVPIRMFYVFSVFLL
jgi:CCR4-NOT transcriptional regulation complex NOT5 subunit